MPGAETWLADFWELSTDRRFEGGRIPAESIASHTTGWPRDEAAMFRVCIRAMDEVWLDPDPSAGEPPQSENPARDAFRAAFR